MFRPRFSPSHGPPRFQGNNRSQQFTNSNNQQFGYTYNSNGQSNTRPLDQFNQRGPRDFLSISPNSSGDHLSFPPGPVMDTRLPPPKISRRDNRGPQLIENTHRGGQHSYQFQHNSAPGPGPGDNRGPQLFENTHRAGQHSYQFQHNSAPGPGNGNSIPTHFPNQGQGQGPSARMPMNNYSSGHRPNSQGPCSWGPQAWNQGPSHRGGMMMQPQSSRQLVSYDDLNPNSQQFSHQNNSFRARGGGYGNRGRGRGGGGFHGGNIPGNLGKRPYSNQRDGDFNGPQTKKQKKQDRPENNAFFCEICDRGFKTQEKYQEHCDGHEQCSIEGCSYKAAPKLVTLHYKWQHATGLAKKIWQLDSKEDIENWRQERRNKFPTAANQAKKEIITKDRETRGEVLATKTFGKISRGRGRGGRDRRGRNGQRTEPNDKEKDSSTKFEVDKRPPSRNEDKSLQPKEIETGSDTKRNVSDSEKAGRAQVNLEVSVGIPKEGDPLSFILRENDLSDSEQGGVKHEAAADANTSGLGSLLASYGEASNSEPEETKVSPKEPVKQTGEDAEDQNNNRRRNRRQKSRGEGRSKSSKARKLNPQKRAPSLLEKLLAPDVRHERNVILQCVRHIVKQNFLGVGKKELPRNQIKNSTAISSDVQAGDKYCMN